LDHHGLPLHLPPFPTRRSSDLEQVAPLAAKSANVAAQQAGTMSRFGVSLDRADRSTTALVQQFAAPAALPPHGVQLDVEAAAAPDRKSTRLNSSHQIISYAVFC